MPEVTQEQLEGIRKLCSFADDYADCLSDEERLALASVRELVSGVVDIPPVPVITVSELEREIEELRRDIGENAGRNSELRDMWAKFRRDWRLDESADEDDKYSKNRYIEKIKFTDYLEYRKLFK